jgi:hypothetical protein
LEHTKVVSQVKLAQMYSGGYERFSRLQHACHRFCLGSWMTRPTLHVQKRTPVSHADLQALKALVREQALQPGPATLPEAVCSAFIMRVEKPT